MNIPPPLLPYLCPPPPPHFILIFFFLHGDRLVGLSSFYSFILPIELSRWWLSELRQFNVDERSLTSCVWARFPDEFPRYAWTLLADACLVVAFHQHFRHTDRGLLCAAVITRGWNGYRHKNESWLRRGTFSDRSCRESNPRPSCQYLHTRGAFPALNMSSKECSLVRPGFTSYDQQT